ncbi:MAG: tetratricopeptide repeat protein, partial [Acidobacteriota bacterium]
RYADAGVLADELRALRGGDDPSSTRVPKPPLVRRLGRPAVAAAAAALLALAVIAFAFLGRPGAPRTVTFAGLRVGGVEAWYGLALEEMLELELAARDTPVEPMPRDAAVLASFEAGGGWSAAQRRQLPGPSDAVFLGGAVSPEPDGQVTVWAALQGRGGADQVAQHSGSPTTLATLAGALADDLVGHGRTPTFDFVAATSRATSHLIEDASRLLARLDSPAALRLLRRASDDDSPLIPLMLAAALWDLGHEDEARARLDAVDAARLPDPWRLYFRARQHELARDDPRAEALYRALFAADAFAELPLEARLDAASALVRTGSPEMALAVLDGAGEDPRAELLRADAHHGLGDPVSQLAAAERATGHASDAEQPFIQARAQRLGAAAAWRRGEFELGLELSRRAATAYRELGHVKGQADAEVAQATVLYEMGDLVVAKDAYSRAARLYASLGNRRAEARTLTEKALVLQQQGDLSARLEATERALDTIRQGGDRRAELITLVDLAAPLAERGRLAEAEAALTGALRLAEEIDRLEAWTRSNYGRFLLESGRFADARRHLQEALLDPEIEGDGVDAATVEQALAVLAIHEGDLPQAEERLDRALPVLLDRGPPAVQSAALRTAARLALLGADFGAAEGHLARASKLAPPRLEQIRVILDRAHVARRLGDRESARRLALEALSEFDLRRAEQMRTQALLVLARFAIRDDDLPLAADRLLDARSRFEADGDLDISPALDRAMRLVALRVDLPLGEPRTRQDLQTLLAEAVEAGDYHLELRTRLAIGRAEIIEGYAAAGERRLAELADEAEARGFVLLARIARAVAGRRGAGG